MYLCHDYYHFTKYNIIKEPNGAFMRNKSLWFSDFRAHSKVLICKFQNHYQVTQIVVFVYIHGTIILDI